ncbi:MAG: DUF1926 domain-containing protein [Candidatus Omnitrophica bacterium]|nr:DUF1926 domain-containing protein [Candidatus Omnitrophota bacterium]
MKIKKGGKKSGIGVKFAMAFHCYQPVFNFDDEIEKAYKNAYLPFLDILEEFPGIKVSFHYSGNLLLWLKAKHPDFIERISRLISLGTVELIGGGCFEPIMTIIPEGDRVRQLEENEKIVKNIFSIRSRGAWLAERVWNMSIVDTFASKGIEYTIIDDYHLVRAGINIEKMYVPYRVKTGKGTLTLFPALTKFRYLIPFCMPGEVIERIRTMAHAGAEGDKCLFFADDGEKFGAWPHTHKWVYKKAWLRNFFRLLTENDRWLKTVRYSDVLDTLPAKEIEEVPQSSYAEMMKWSGGNFRNFLKKYPEAGRMHERMISVSGVVDEIAPPGASENVKEWFLEAKEEVLKAQSNCAYWHGVFGGVYLPHLRSGVYKHLIKAQDLIDGADEKIKKRSIPVRDYDSSSREISIDNRFIRIFIKSFSGGAVSEIDYKPSHVNLTNTISRIRETYHEKLRRSYAERIRAAREMIKSGNYADINDIVGLARRGLRKELVYDGYRRMSFLTHIFKSTTPLRKRYKKLDCYDSFLSGEYASNSKVDNGNIVQSLTRRDKISRQDGSIQDVEVKKKITLGEKRNIEFEHEVNVKNAAGRMIEYGVEFNFLIWDKKFLVKPKITKTDRIFLEDQYSRVKVKFFFDKKFSVLTYPLYSVNETENGLNKTFQGISVLVGDERARARDGALSGGMKIKMEIEGK